MSDLCAPVYVVMGGDEEMTFWCFVQIMERMVRPPAQTVLSAAFDAIAFVMTETELPPRPERHEEAAVDPAAADLGHGPGAISTSWYAPLSLMTSPLDRSPTDYRENGRT